MRNRWRRYRRAAFVMVVVVGMLALPSAGALAHGTHSEVLVGIEEATGNVENQFDDASLNINAGATLTFDWDVAAQFHDVTWEAGNPEVFAKVGPVGSGTTQYTFNTPGTYYYFCDLHADPGDAAAEDWVQAETDNATGSKMVGRIVVTADTTSPVWDPGSATATPVSSSQIDLTWPTATDDSGTVFFDVFQAAGATNPGRGAATLVGDDVSGTSFSDTGLTAGETYWYWIAPVDGAGNAGPELQANATTSSVAASASATTVLDFSIDATLAIAVTPSVAFGNEVPGVPSDPETAVATVDSNASWSMNIRSQDPSFSNGSASIPLDRAQFAVNGGAATTLTNVDQQVLTGQGATVGGPATVNVDWTLTPTFSDPVGANFQTTVLYTVTQP